MVRRTLRIGRWLVYFFFVKKDYDIDMILSFLDTFECPLKDMERAEQIMYEGEPDKAFTYANPFMRRALVVIGPTSSGDEFLNSFSHEIRHLANMIASSIGYKLDAEEPSYLTGDSVRELADVVCRFGCPHCNT